MKLIIIINIFLMLFFATNNIFAKNEYFNEGENLYKDKKFKKAKFKFEQDIVFNPKSEKSYLYLSRIFNIQENKDLEERNLKTVILLNPKNEEAIYNLAKLKLTKSNYTESQKLIENLLLFCNNYCEKSNQLKTEIENSLKK